MSDIFCFKSHDWILFEVVYHVFHADVKFGCLNSIDFGL